MPGPRTHSVFPMFNKSSATGGIGLGSIIAVVLSWSANHSVLWAVIHGFLGWLYVIYYLVTR
ncbi:MAG TPA: hypothetical protein VF576_02580 [Rubricoccaceae bacterium]